MLGSESYKQDFDTDPQPRFATDADIATAERLRRQLEERYLGRAAAPAASPRDRPTQR